MKKDKIIIVDDHEIFSNGIKLILDSNLNVEVTHHFDNASDAMMYFKNGGAADLVMLDLYMPGISGFEFLEFIQEHGLELKILVVSMQSSDANVSLCKKLGAHGYIRKDSSLKEMILAVKEVLNGKKHFPIPVKGAKSEDKIENALGRLCNSYKLSKAETKILDMLLEQKKNKEIADELFLSPFTVKTHRKNIYRKFKVSSLAGIVGLLKGELEK